MFGVADVERATGCHPDPLGGQGDHCVSFITDGNPEVQARPDCGDIDAAFLQCRDEVRSAFGIGKFGIGNATLDAFVTEQIEQHALEESTRPRWAELTPPH
jgi:hypothetical protein